MHACAAAGAGFLIAVLWFDLMFDVQTRKHSGDTIPAEVLASISAYYRRVTIEAYPMNRAIAGGMVIRPHLVSDFIDVGTLPDWRRYVRARGSIVTDLDGVVFQNHSAYFAPFWDDEDIAIDENVTALRAWAEQGAQLIFMTARPEAWRQKTERALNALGLTPHALIMGCNHGRRFLVNDHAATNPYPSAVAVSVERNSANLADYLKDWL